MVVKRRASTGTSQVMSLQSSIALRQTRPRGSAICHSTKPSAFPSIPVFRSSPSPGTCAPGRSPELDTRYLSGYKFPCQTE